MVQKPFYARLTPARRRLINRELGHFLDLDGDAVQRRLESLGQRCPRIAGHLERLLRASQAPTGFLDTLFERVGQAAGEDRSAPPPALPEGTRLGPWRLIEPVGVGGMGMVYRGERADGAFEMTAAIKLIRGSGPELEARLAEERRLLARLDHAHIARLLDGGTTGDGLGFLVMEWVPGQDLDDYLANHRQPRQRLAIFRQVAEALAHAHQRLIVHGDIKPANIRVMPDGRARLLDFGIARVLADENDDQPGDEPTALTPAFAAPEQLEGQSASVLTDIYSLGMLLRWLITGEPAATAHGELPASSIPAGWPRPNDLAAIVNRACADDPEQRYSAVAALIQDLDNYLDRRAVNARHGGRLYLLTRFIQRNWLGAGLTALAVLSLLAGLIGTSWQAQRAAHERDRAELERDRARLEARRTRQVSDFLVDLFEHADPGQALGEDITARQLLDYAGSAIEGLEQAPGVQSEMLLVLSRVNQSLGRFDIASAMAEQGLELRRQILGISTVDLVRAMLRLGDAMRADGRASEAVSLLQQALDLVPTDDPLIHLIALNKLGAVLDETGDYASAVAKFEQALVLAGEHTAGSELEATVHQNLGSALYHLDRIEPARDHMRQAVEIYRQHHPATHPLVTRARTNLAHLHGMIGDTELAESELLSIIEAMREVLGDAHPELGTTLHGLGSLHFRNRDVEQAEYYWRQALEVHRAAGLGDDNPLVAAALNALGLAAWQAGELDQAEDYMNRALDSFRQAYGEGHVRVPMALANLSLISSARGDMATAERLQLEALALYEPLVGEYHHHVASTRANLANLHRQQGQFEQAMDWAQQAKYVYRTIYSDDHPQVERMRNMIADIDEGYAGDRRQ